MQYRAISLHAPWGTLLFTRQPCAGDCLNGTLYVRTGVDTAEPIGRCPCNDMVKRFETRSWPCPPSIIGQRVAFHQAKRRPDVNDAQGLWRLGDWWVEDDRLGGFSIHHADGTGADIPLPLGAVLGTGIITASYEIRIGPDGSTPMMAMYEDQSGAYVPLPIPDDQLPYGDWTPGRHAWLITDPQPLPEPIPAKGRQGWWTWEAP